MLAAIHFNSNADRKQATTSDGDLQWKLARPQANKRLPVAKVVKTPVSHGMIAT